MKKSLSLLMGLLLTLTAGCGLIKVREKDEAAVKKIKKVAVVSFSLYQPVSPMQGVGEFKEDMAGENQKVKFHGQYPSHAKKMYKALGQKLKNNLNWRVMSLGRMTQKSGYKASYDSTMKGFQNKFSRGKDVKHYLVKDVMDFDSARLLDVEGRNQLIDSLGVDALVVAMVTVNLEGTTVMGLGNRYPKAMMTLQVYRKGSPKPIWFDGGIKGEKSKVSVGKTKFINHELTSKESLTSAISAFSKIGKEL